MRKFLIPLVAAGSALSLAVPAAAQWAPPVYNYQPYNFGYGFNEFNFARSMTNRVQRLRADIHNLHVRRILSFAEARSLDTEARTVERRIYNASRHGITNREARNVENRVHRLEVRISREARDWNGRPRR